jgi:hypothetical protein
MRTHNTVRSTEYILPRSHNYPETDFSPENFKLMSRIGPHLYQTLAVSKVYGYRERLRQSRLFNIRSIIPISKNPESVPAVFSLP